jgi:hypothetical protein
MVELFVCVISFHAEVSFQSVTSACINTGHA